MLSDTAIKALKSTGKEYTKSDGRGLSVLVHANGSKYWLFKYTIDGKQRKMSLGVYPDISLAQARERCEAQRKLVADGINPVDKKLNDKLEKLAVANQSFEIWAKKWHEHWSNGKSERHARQTWRRLEQNVFTIIGKKGMANITSVDVMDVLKSMQDTPDLASRGHQTISAIFRYAITHSHQSKCYQNPASFFKPSDVIATHKKENYARVDIKEFPALLRAIDNSDTRSTTRIAIKLMALTFVRTSELIEAEWSEFDLENKQWRIPAERMKMKSPHIVPLSSQAVQLLVDLQKITAKYKHLFPNQNDTTKAMSNNTILKALERMGYKGRMTGHGFRGIASTALHELGYDHAHIELQLAHSERDAVSSAYNHALYIPQRTQLMQSWADYIDDLKFGAKVLPFVAKSGS